MADHSLHQLKVSYNQTHDRLILILHTKSFHEYQFWITRRALPILWKVLSHLIDTDKKSQEQHVKETEKWAEAIEKEKQQKHATAEQLVTQVSTRPMGDEPLLLNKIQGGLGPNNTFKMRLEDINGLWIEFGGDTGILIALCQLILQVLDKAEWGLDLKIPQ